MASETPVYAEADAAVEADADAAAEARAGAAAIAIPAHVVEAKGHDQAGAAMALAPLSHVLFCRVKRHNPSNPQWIARDRFVLSAGHASLLLYVRLVLTGYGLILDDIAASRKLGSLTPGRPSLITPSGQLRATDVYKRECQERPRVGPAPSASTTWF